MLLGHLSFELFASDGFTGGEFGGDVSAFEGFQGFADIAVAHGRDILEEGNQRDEFFVIRISFPFP